MTDDDQRSGARGAPGPATGVADLVASIGYEVMPFTSTERAVLDHVPTAVPLTVTATGNKGIDPTIDLSVRLAARGYEVAPHLAARIFSSEGQLAEVVGRITEAGIRRLFVIGGDEPTPLGPYPDAHSLLVAIDALGHTFDGIGIGGYPEGHALIDDAALAEALKAKAPFADRLITQMCFDADATAAWTRRLVTDGIDLPVHVGLPGPVNRQKLIRISAGLGLGRSARFLQKQHSAFWRFVLPGGYRPDRLVRQLGEAVGREPTTISGLHIFTFNELERTEAWRSRLVASVSR